jgi:hypothetical protein
LAARRRLHERRTENEVVMATVMVGVVIVAYLAAFAGGVLMVPAILALRAGLVGLHRGGELLVVMSRAVFPGSGWRRGVDAGSLEAVETYRRRRVLRTRSSNSEDL